LSGDKGKKREGRSDQRKGRAKEKKGDLKDLLKLLKGFCEGPAFRWFKGLPSTPARVAQFLLRYVRVGVATRPGPRLFTTD
jgi:hypothetical protein